MPRVSRHDTSPALPTPPVTWPLYDLHSPTSPTVTSQASLGWGGVRWRRGRLFLNATVTMVFRYAGPGILQKWNLMVSSMPTGLPSAHTHAACACPQAEPECQHVEPCGPALVQPRSAVRPCAQNNLHHSTRRLET